MKRMNRIFKEDGKTVIVAMDHGMGMFVNPELDDMGSVIKAIVAGGADAILTTYGVAVKYQDELKDVGLILRLDGGSSFLNKNEYCPKLLYTVEDALKVGADAVAVMGFPGAVYEDENMQNLADIARQGHEWGVPVMAEALPGGFNPAVPNSVENLVVTSHTCCEYGANIIKTTFNGTKEEFKKVIDASYQPVVVLGGEATKDLASLFQVLEDSIAVGAQGVAIGRNVWKHNDPEKVTRALVDLVHNGKKAADIQGL